MLTQMNLANALRTSRPIHWAESGSWLGFSLVGGLLPIWGHWVLLVVFREAGRWRELLISNGELALYSAAFLASAMYLIAKNRNESNFVHRPVFLLVALAALLMATIIFAGPTAVRTLGGPTERLDREMLVTLSLPLFGISVGFTFLVTVLDNIRMQPDVRAIASDQQAQLGRQFDELGGGN